MVDFIQRITDSNRMRECDYCGCDLRPGEYVTARYTVEGEGNVVHLPVEVSVCHNCIEEIEE